MNSLTLFEPGKLTEELKTHVPDVTAMSARRTAHDLGMSVSEYVRDLVCLAEHGTTYDELMREHRRKLRERQGQAVGQPQPGPSPEQGQTVATVGVRRVA